MGITLLNKTDEIEKQIYVHRHVIQSLVVQNQSKKTYKLAGATSRLFVKTSIELRLAPLDLRDLSKSILSQFNSQQTHRFDNCQCGFFKYRDLEMGWHIEYRKNNKPLKMLPYFQFQGIEFRVLVTESI